MYFIEPEVSGQFGDETILDTSTHPPVVNRLHFVFYGWLGDDIIECFQVFLVSYQLLQLINQSSLTGYQIGNCIIKESEEFKILHPEINLPQFFWFQVKGTESDDFSIYNNRLKVSDKAFYILKSFNLNHASIEKINNISN